MSVHPPKKQRPARSQMLVFGAPSIGEEEIAALRRSLVLLEASLRSQSVRPPAPEAPWWSSLREEIDVP